MIIPENMRLPGLTAFFTDRNTGVENSILSRFSRMPESSLFMPLQRHTDRVFVLEGPCHPLEADAVVTDKRGVLLGVRVADCVPLLLYDREKVAIGVVHAGWRGTAKGILGKTLQVMADRFSTEFNDILISFGPSIRGCCYSVDKDVLRAVEAATGGGDYIDRRDDKNCLDLVAANRIQALSIGVPEGNLWISEECTYCHPERFHSYRYSKTKERQGGFIGLRGM